MTGLLCLTADEVAHATNGHWVGDTSGLEMSRVTYGVFASDGDLSFTTNDDQWKHNAFPVKPTEHAIDWLIKRGAKAIVIREKSAPKTPLGIPVLVVSNTFRALRQLSDAVVERCNHCKRILITGTEGKTGFKNIGYHLLDSQFSTNAFLDSANINRDIWRSISSIRSDDEFALIEACADINDARNVERYGYIHPDVCVITNISPVHMNSHKTIERVIRAKALCVGSLKSDGVCIVNASHPYYAQLEREMLGINPGLSILKYGYSDDCDAFIKHSEFDTKEYGWKFTFVLNGNEYNAFVPAVNEYYPLSALSIFLLMAHFELDIDKGIADLLSHEAFPTAGKLYLACGDANILVSDHSYRASEQGLRSALTDISHLDLSGRRRIGVMAHMKNYPTEEAARIAHQGLLSSMEEANFDVLYTFGSHLNDIASILGQKGVQVCHVDSDYEEFEKLVVDGTMPNDFLFIKSQLAFKFSNIIKAIERKYQSSANERKNIR
jgi:UDP-N-acetylmuramoyl-tripeptide--D-alanyl-D-alanine ligase